MNSAKEPIFIFNAEFLRVTALFNLAAPALPFDRLTALSKVERRV